MTEARLAQLRRDGQGSGRDEHYKPWIRVRRKLSSPVSNLHTMTSPLYRRSLQLLSGLEQAAANVALWLGCPEIREQHPFWPEEHPHPLSGRHPDLDRKFGKAPGLMELAQRAGIKHGFYPGTKVPFVATIDFTLSLGGWSSTSLVHWSCKPRALLDGAPTKERMLERIEMERLYSAAVGGTHIVVDGTKFSQQLIGNLDWFRPLRSQVTSPWFQDCMAAFSARFEEVSGDSLFNATRYAAEKAGLSKPHGGDVFRAAAWKGLIDIDFSKPIVMSRPPQRDAGLLKQRLRTELLGDRHA